MNPLTQCLLSSYYNSKDWVQPSSAIDDNHSPNKALYSVNAYLNIESALLIKRGNLFMTLVDNFLFFDPT